MSHLWTGSVEKRRSDDVISRHPCNSVTCDVLGDHVNTDTAHSSSKKAHDWTVERLSDLFHTTHRVKTQQVTKNRGQRCGDIDLTDYLSVADVVVLLLLLLLLLCRC